MSVTNQDTLDLGLPDPVDWRETAMNMLIDFAHQGDPFQAHDLTDAGLPDPPHPNHWGSLFTQAAQEGIIHPVRWTYSRRPTRSSGVCREWIGTAFTKQAHQLVA